MEKHALKRRHKARQMNQSNSQPVYMGLASVLLNLQFVCLLEQCSKLTVEFVRLDFFSFCRRFLPSVGKKKSPNAALNRWQMIKVSGEGTQHVGIMHITYLAVVHKFFLRFKFGSISK